MIYSPSLACADPLNLENEIIELNQCGISWIHFDIMDGHYVPNLCLNLDTAKAIKKRFPEMLLDVHIMATNPEFYIQPLSELGAKNVAFHFDATHFSFRMIRTIHSFGMQAGVVLNPSQSVNDLLPLIREVDYILVMSVEPGFAGQTFIENTYEKVKMLADIRRENGLKFQISVDGGIDAQIGKKLKELETNILILGYPAIFRQKDGIMNSFIRYKNIVER